MMTEKAQSAIVFDTEYVYNSPFFEGKGSAVIFTATP